MRTPVARLAASVAALATALLPSPAGAVPAAAGAIASFESATAIVATGAGSQATLVTVARGYGTDALGGAMLVVAVCRQGTRCTVERRGVRAGELSFGPSAVTLDAVGTSAGRITLSWTRAATLLRQPCERLAPNGGLLETSLTSLGAGEVWSADVGGTVGGSAVAAGGCAAAGRSVLSAYQVAS